MRLLKSCNFSVLPMQPSKSIPFPSFVIYILKKVTFKELETKTFKVKHFAANKLSFIWGEYQVLSLTQPFLIGYDSEFVHRHYLPLLRALV